VTTSTQKEAYIKHTLNRLNFLNLVGVPIHKSYGVVQWGVSSDTITYACEAVSSNNINDITQLWGMCIIGKEEKTRL